MEGAERLRILRIASAFLWVGATSLGGSSSSYLLAELVHRRKWLRREEWMEGVALGRILPGTVASGCAMFLGHQLGGPAAALLSYALFCIPGVLVALLLSALTFSAGLPLWAGSLIHALSASAFGVVLVSSLGNLSAVRNARLGPVVCVGAFVAYGLLHASLPLVLLGAGAASLVANETRRKPEGV